MRRPGVRDPGSAVRERPDAARWSRGGNQLCRPANRRSFRPRLQQDARHVGTRGVGRYASGSVTPVGGVWRYRLAGRAWRAATTPGPPRAPALTRSGARSTTCEVHPGQLQGPRDAGRARSSTPLDRQLRARAAKPRLRGPPPERRCAAEVPACRPLSATKTQIAAAQGPPPADVQVFFGPYMHDFHAQRSACRLKRSSCSVTTRRPRARDHAPRRARLKRTSSAGHRSARVCGRRRLRSRAPTRGGASCRVQHATARGGEHERRVEPRRDGVQRRGAAAASGT